MPLHNECFSNAVEGQNKIAELEGYIFPVPLKQVIQWLESNLSSLNEMI